MNALSANGSHHEPRDRAQFPNYVDIDGYLP